MGHSKAELFLSRIQAAARPAFDRVVAVERADGVAQPIPTIFEHPHQGEAPVFGVQRALEHAASRCVILATDYPLITTGFLQRLRREFETTAAPMLVPISDGRPQVLCAGYDPVLLPIIQQRIRANHWDLRGLLDEVPAQTFEAGGLLLANVNTPAEWQAVERES